MKISSISIKDFHQFKDVFLDLTYPKGHKNEGQPLQKVCFLGQSGTGKTSILELIPSYLVSYKTSLVERSGINSIAENIDMRVVFGIQNQNSFLVKYGTDKENKQIRLWSEVRSHEERTDFDLILASYKKWTTENASKIIYYPANLDYNINIGIEDSKSVFDKKIIDFSRENIAMVWDVILEKITKYQEQEIKFRLEISNYLEQGVEDLDVIEKALEKLREWKKNEFNPIQDVADNCLDKLLEPLKLKVKTKLDFKSKDDIGFIKIEDYESNEIPNGLWSTGTKQVILSALPLYLLKPKHTLILFDEPERSLYPDMQRLIVDYYASLTTDCQFFYSTHSPIIASNFEPWEIVELKFDTKGKVYRELYYEGENNISNYKWSPKYMRWDDILQRVFDLENDGSEARKQKLDELAKLNVKHKKLQKQGKGETLEASKVVTGIEQLSKELSKWD